MKKLYGVVLFIFFVASFSYGEEYLWGNKKSQVFLSGTNVEDVWKLWFAARMRILMGEYIVTDKGHKITYEDNIAVTEIQTDSVMMWSFILPFNNSSDAFNFFFDVQNQLSLFVTVHKHNGEFDSFFKDGEFGMNLVGNFVTVVILTIS